MHSNLEIDIAVASGHRGKTKTNRLHALEANMKKYITLITFLALLVGLSAIPVIAQLTGTDQQERRISIRWIYTGHL
jgi:hypothetical protein